MKSKNDIFEAGLELSGLDWILLLESSLSEGLAYDDGEMAIADTNLFGRKVIHFEGADLAKVMGMATSGLRTAAVAGADTLWARLPELRSAYRQRLPLVIHVANLELDGMEGSRMYGMAGLDSLRACGAIVLLSSGMQEAADNCLIARRIAELSLTPVVHILDGSLLERTHKLNVLSPAAIRKFLGSPDESIEAPTPAQKLLFGPQRRRIPRWFDLDLPASLGARKEPDQLGLEAAAAERFADRANASIIRGVMEDFTRISGRRQREITDYHCSDASWLLITAGAGYHGCMQAVDILRKKGRKAGCLGIRCMNPFPKNELGELVKGKKTVTVLEPVGLQKEKGGNIAQWLVSGLRQLPDRQRPGLLEGWFVPPMSGEAALAAFENMIDPKAQKNQYYLGIEFTGKSPDYPKYEILLQTLKREYPGIDTEAIPVCREGSDSKGDLSPQKDHELPTFVSRYADQGPAWSRLSYFRDHSALFAKEENRGSGKADPFQALPVMPPASAALQGWSLDHKFPDFDAGKCTACGSCFTYCPHSALPPLAIRPEELLRKAMDLAGSTGPPIVECIPLIKNWAMLASKNIRSGDIPAEPIEEFKRAFGELLEKMKISGEKRDRAMSEMERILAVLQAGKFSVTDSLFTTPESQQKSTGALFTIALDPFSCTSCGLCSTLCPEQALPMKALDRDAEKSLEAEYRLWEQLPDTPSDIISRLNHDPAYDPFASVLLSRNFYKAMSGSRKGEGAPPAKTMIHLLSALGESVMQSGQLNQIKLADERIDQLSSSLKKEIEEVFPMADLDQWTALMEGAERPKISLAGIAERLGETHRFKPLDTHLVKRKLELLRELKELRDLLGKGPGGQGRARMAMVLQESPELQWATSFPSNVFTCPVLINGDDQALGKTVGLVHAHIRHSIDNIKLLRRAELEAKGKYDPLIHDEEIAGLEYGELTEEERKFIAPIWLVGMAENLLDPSLSALQELLGSNLPIRVCLLDAAVTQSNRNAVARIRKTHSMLLSIIGMQNAYVLKASLADRRHLFFGLKEGLAQKGPAVFWLYNPDVAAHELGDGDWTVLERPAVQSRAFPLLKYKPGAGIKLSAGLDISMNPGLEGIWPVEDPGDENAADLKARQYTYAHWLYSIKSWRPLFIKAGEHAATTRLADWLNSGADGQKGALPVIVVLNDDGEMEDRVVPEAAIEMVQIIASQWNALRDLAGLLTPWPEKLRTVVRDELEAEYADKMERMRRDLERERQEMEERQLQRIKEKLKERLLRFSEQKKTTS